jgi:RNA polymerase sigma-70 factor (ECF subfamily)
MAEAQALSGDHRDGMPLAEVSAATLAGCAAGDGPSMHEFVVRYEPVVFAYLSRTLGRGSHVEDLAQDVFLKALRAIAQFDPRGAARCSTWLLTIARHAVADFRKRKRESLLDRPDTHDEALDMATPETEHRRSEIGAALARAAASLPDEQRDAFILAEFHDLSMAEMADVAGVPVGTFKARLSRARQRMRELLGPTWEEQQ